MAYTTIKKPSDYFNTILYTGNGTGTQSQTGVGFEPDMVWVKSRNAANYHGIADQVRGVDKFIYPNDTLAEQTNATDYLNSFDSDGFTHGSNGTIGQNSVNYAAWNWLASNTSGSSNTDGSITSTVSVNTTAGFSIVSWTGTGANATIGHGLGSVPKMILLKCRTQPDKWIVYHNSIGNTKYLVLNGTDAETTSSTHWNNTSPTNSVFSTGSSGNVSGVGETFIAYCFAEKTGYSKFGSYVGNGSTDGTFIYTGFKPAFVIYKGASGANAADNWEMADNKRSVYNGVENVLYPNLSNAEGTGVTTRLDLLSNGFKMRTGATDYNGSGQTYIYIAFAEEPLVGDNPATAR